jgi:hypothetical protein
MAHPVWTDQELNSVTRTHKKPANLTDRTALTAVKLCKFIFDSLTLFKWGTLTEKKVLNRAIFLETVAAVPGMVIMPPSNAQIDSCKAFVISNVRADCRHAAPLEISPEDGSRPWLDPHASGGGGKRTHALADILETATTGHDLQAISGSYSGEATIDEIYLENLGQDLIFLAGHCDEPLLHHLPCAPCALPPVSCTSILASTWVLEKLTTLVQFRRIH